MQELLTHFADTLQTSLPLSLLVAYLAGVLASLTPCVYPMIPITASIIGSSNLGGSRRRGFVLSLTYTTGLAIMYAGLGVFAAATGQLFGSLTTMPLVPLLVGNILLLLGLIMLEVLPFPTLTLGTASPATGLAGTLIAGMLAALVAGPCTAPVLGALLTYAASGGNLVRGGLILFVFAFGLGSLLLAIGTFAGLLATLPKSGPWLQRIRLIFATSLIVLAEYFIFKAGTLAL